MMKKYEKLIALVLALVLTLSAVPGALAAGKKTGSLPSLTGNPKENIVEAGGECIFHIQETGATGITWHFYNPITEEDVLASKINTVFPDVTVGGQNSHELRLWNIPAELDGWEVYCMLANKAGRIASKHASLYVTVSGADNETEAEPQTEPLTEAETEPQTEAETEPLTEAETEPAVEPVPVATAVPVPAATMPPAQQGEKQVYAVGAYLNNDPSVTQLRFDTELNLLITADVPNGKTLAYWLINGVRVDFPTSVYRFSLSGLDQSLWVEAVFR